MRRTAVSRASVERKAQALLAKLKPRSLPIPLFPLAHEQGVRVIRLAPMIPEGGLRPVAGGFEIYLKHPESSQIAVDRSNEGENLTVRQRFTLAHEIAHTFFFDLSTSIPTALYPTVDDLKLERLCNVGASLILVPEASLIARMKEHTPITPTAVLTECKVYRVSAEVLLRRINEIDALKTVEHGLVYARAEPDREDATILAFSYHYALQRLLPAPKEYSSLRQWCGKLLDEEFWRDPRWRRERRLGSSLLVLEKEPRGTRPSPFFITIQLKHLTWTGMPGEKSSTGKERTCRNAESPPT